MRKKVFYLKILIVSCVDDNFGDNLIRICFEKLMYTALKNSGMDHEKVELAKMPHKAIDRDLIISSDILFLPAEVCLALTI